ncbi:MAG: alanine dehydrogenase [Actinobacteria bacterium]|nr:alanine dehydrogenase [Actinomycetota bacterium]MCL6105089.1 alanine dehydrogenase [Actinomycetota bacterium]
MIIGVPLEVKPGENRVGITPEGIRELTAHGHRVIIEKGAGEGSSIRDSDFVAGGAEIGNADTAWSAELVLKVKEPQEEELGYLRPELTLFTYLHLATYPKLTKALLDAKTVAIGYETVQLPSTDLPLLTPMSEVAGRLAPQIGAHWLEKGSGGRGVLLGGAPGVRPARVVIIGAGNVGWNAAWIAQGMEAEVFLIDKNVDRLRFVDQIHKGRIMTLTSNRGIVEDSVAQADLLIGAVLVPGGKAPTVVTEEMIKTMKPGSVIIDVAIDQGGCVETMHETTHESPVFELDGVLHYGVGNIPAAVPNTSTYALSNVTVHYVVELAKYGPEGTGQAAYKNPAIKSGINTAKGHLTNSMVGQALGIATVDPLVALE